MTLKRALGLDVICWALLIVGIWIGPVWVSKLAISIMIIWNSMCIYYLARNTIPLTNKECLDNECNCDAHLKEYTGQNFN